MKPEIDPEGDKYYRYILCYLDDVLVVHNDAMTTLMEIDKYFKLKPSSIGDPDSYLGAKLKYTCAENGVCCWTLSPSKYVQEACKNCETFLKNNFDGKYSLPKMADNTNVESSGLSIVKYVINNIMSTSLTGRRKTATYLHIVHELLYNID